MRRVLAGVTIFLGSFLLFGAQPMVGRTLLPLFGGTAAVWVVCLCAFQVLLLAGYGYACAFAPGGRGRRLAHLALLLLGAGWAFAMSRHGAALAGALAAGGGAAPALRALLCVCALAGLPYVLLSANSTLVQAWSGAGEGAYRLYAVSNAGSLAGLLAYPLLLEPFVGVPAQWALLGGGIAVYAALLAAPRCDARPREGGARRLMPREGDARRLMPREGDARRLEGDARPAPLRGGWLWFGLPCLSCFLLNAVTAHMTLDVMPMPLLWALLLGLFLLSYVIGFSGFAERRVRGLAFAALALGCAVCWLNGKSVREVPAPAAVGVYGLFLLGMCTCLHAALYRSRPGAARLPRFYLLGAAGGAAGGALASLAAPALFATVAEYPLALAAAGACAAWACADEGMGRVGRMGRMGRGRAGARPSRAGVFAALLLVAGAVLYLRGAAKEERPVVYRGRGFFGTVEVLESKARAGGRDGVVREFVHGTTIHGIQALLPGRERMPTTYYTPDSSGWAIAAHPKYRRGEPMRVNVTGLGVGVLFCYGRRGDYYRAYEISPEAMRVATDTNLFTFVADCPAEKELVLGDARRGLERELAEGAEPYDVIVVDAFTGDNLPYHLSTREAFDLYFKLLKPDGVLAVNISNWHLTLEPFMKAVGEAYDVPLLGLETRDDFARLAFGAKVAFFCREPGGLAPPPATARPIPFDRWRSMGRLPTDAKGSFVGLIRPAAPRGGRGQVGGAPRGGRAQVGRGRGQVGGMKGGGR